MLMGSASLDQFDSSDAGFAGKTVAEVKQAFVKGQLSVGAFYCVYLALIIFLVGIPEISNLDDGLARQILNSNPETVS